MRTTTRSIFKKDDIYYDGISYGTPIGQIMFVWSKDDKHVSVNHEQEDGTWKTLLTVEVNYHELQKLVVYVNQLIKDQW